MKTSVIFAYVVAACLTTVAAGQDLDRIHTVGIDENRAILVNQKPFFPIMIWLQDPENFDSARSAGINTITGYWSGSGGTKDVAEYLGLVEKAGFYAVMPFDQQLRENPALLGYIHGDEPDLPHQVTDTRIEASEQLKINTSTPLWKIFDGVTHSWSVLDPLEGAEFTLKPAETVEIQQLGIWLTTSEGLAIAKEISFEADGKEIARATLKNEKGRQEITLQRPVSLKELSVKIHSTYPGKHVWGSISEIEGLDSKGTNVLLSPPRQVPRAMPAEVLDEYNRVKSADSSRPIFMTLTGHFLPHFEKWTDDQRTSLYPAYVKATDIVGYDIYPIYGWNKPEWLYLVHDGTEELRRLAGNRPVYSWIETSRGGQWTGDLERQKPVTPEHIRAEVWMAICRGATAIGYFTHIWKPEYKQFGVPPENVEAMKQINDQITRLAPAILSEPIPAGVSIELEGQLKADITARQHDGWTYLFAVNYDPQQKTGRATIKVQGLRKGTRVEVVEEDRAIEATDSEFTDDFDPLDVHIYRVKL